MNESFSSYQNSNVDYVAKIIFLNIFFFNIPNSISLVATETRFTFKILAFNMNAFPNGYPCLNIALSS